MLLSAAVLPSAIKPDAGSLIQHCQIVCGFSDELVPGLSHCRRVYAHRLRATSAAAQCAMTLLPRARSPCFFGIGTRCA